MLESVWDNAAQKQLGRLSRAETQPVQPFNELLSSERRSLLQDFWQPPDDVPRREFMFKSHAQLNDEAFLKLANDLKQNALVKHLIASHNSLSFSEFSKAGVMDLLKTNHEIGWLVFGHNEIRDEGALVLAEALRENRGAKHLVLSHNYIADDGLVALLDAILAHPVLESLFIAHNSLGSTALEHCKHFLESLPPDSSFKRLDLSGHSFSDYTLLTRLKDLCQRRGVRLIL